MSTESKSEYISRKQPNEMIGVRFPPADRAWIEEACREHGFTISEMLRGLVLAARDQGLDTLLKIKA